MALNRAGSANATSESMRLSRLLGASAAAAVLLGVVGILLDWEAFLIEALGGLVAFAVGIPFAGWVFERERAAEREAERETIEAELDAVIGAGVSEARRLEGVADDIAMIITGDPPVSPVAPIVGYWGEHLGPRLYALTGEDDALHELRQSHGALERAFARLDAAEAPSPPHDPKRLMEEAGMEAHRARRWAEMAIKTLEASNLAVGTGAASDEPASRFLLRDRLSGVLAMARERLSGRRASLRWRRGAWIGGRFPGSWRRRGGRGRGW